MIERKYLRVWPTNLCKRTVTRVLYASACRSRCVCLCLCAFLWFNKLNLIVLNSTRNRSIYRIYKRLRQQNIEEEKKQIKYFSIEILYDMHWIRKICNICECTPLMAECVMYVIARRFMQMQDICFYFHRDVSECAKITQGLLFYFFF